MPTRELSAKNIEGGASNLSSNHDNDSDESSDNGEGYKRRFHHDGRVEGGRGELKQLQDSLSRFFTPSNRRRSRVAQGSISLEHLDRDTSTLVSPTSGSNRDSSLHNGSGNEKSPTPVGVAAHTTHKRAGRRRKNVVRDAGAEKVKLDYLRPLAVITDESKINSNNNTFYNAQPSCSLSKSGLSSPSPRHKNDAGNDTSPYLSGSSERRRSSSKGNYVGRSSGRRRSLKSNGSSSTPDQMPALPCMVGNSEGEHSNSDSVEETETMDVLVDENSTWAAGAASSQSYQSLLQTPKLTPQSRRGRRTSYSATSPLSVTSHNETSFDSNFSLQLSLPGQKRKTRGCRSGLQQYRMRRTHPNLRSGTAALRKQESAASLVRKARSRRRLRINQLITTALKSASGRRPGRKPKYMQNNSMAEELPRLSPEKSFNNNSNEQNRPKEFISPTRALLKNKFANGELTDLTDLDRNLFDAARQKVREELASQCHNCMPGVGVESASTPSRNPRYIRIGQFEIETWYSSPYPEEYARLDTLFLCEFCLKYMKSEMTEQRHYRKCEYRTPPGDEIYRNDKISVFEVDGNISRIYCQNVCLLAKLFLDHKTLYYDVEPFLFYVVTKSDDAGCHFVGYFSKEKYSAQRYNLSCIMTLPAYQRQGFGRFLIDFSFLLTRRENMLGTPERPLSDLGQISYRSYWQSAICEYIHEAFTVNQHRKVTIKSIARGTGISAADVVETLAQLEMLEHVDSQDVLVINWSLIENHWKKIMSDKGRIWIDESKLTWSPKVYTPSKDYGVRSPNSTHSPTSPLKALERSTVLSPLNDGHHEQHFEENSERKVNPSARRKLFPSIEQKIRKNARKGRPPASGIKQSVLRPSSSVNFHECAQRSPDEKFQKEIFSLSRNTCKNDIHQRLNVRRKSSDDDSPGGRKSHTRGRGRKCLRRGPKKRVSGAKEDTSSLLSNDETKKKSYRNLSTPSKLESSFGSGSSDDSEEPLSKHLVKKNVDRRAPNLKLMANIPKKGGGFSGRGRKTAVTQRRMVKGSRYSDGELSSSSSGESSSCSDSENAIRKHRNNAKVRNGGTVDLTKKGERKRRKAGTATSDAVVGYRRRSSLSSSSTSLSSYNSNSESTERLKATTRSSRNSPNHRSCTEIHKKKATESLSGASESTTIVNVSESKSNGDDDDDETLSGGDEERKSLSQCGAEPYDHTEKDQSLLSDDDVEKAAAEIPFVSDSIPMMEVSAGSVQDTKEPGYNDDLSHQLSEMPQLRVADNVENAYDDEDAPPCLSPNFAPTEDIDEDSPNNGSDDAPAPLLLEGAVPISYSTEMLVDQVKTTPPAAVSHQSQETFSNANVQTPKGNTVLNTGCEMVNIGGEAASDDDDDMDGQNAASSCHSPPLDRHSCDPAMMTADFDRPLGAPRPADDPESQNVTFDGTSYAKNEEGSVCDEYNAKPLNAFNEMICEAAQVTAHSPVVSSSSNMNNMVSPHFLPSSSCTLQQQTPVTANPCMTTPQQSTELCTTSPNTFMGSNKTGSGGSAASTPHGPSSQHSQQMMSGEHSAFMSPPMPKPTIDEICIRGQGNGLLPTMNDSIRSEKPIVPVATPVQQQQQPQSQPQSQQTQPQPQPQQPQPQQQQQPPPQQQHQTHRRGSKKEHSRSSKVDATVAAAAVAAAQHSQVDGVLPLGPYVLSTSRPQPSMPTHFSQVGPSQAAHYYGGYAQPVPPSPFDTQFYPYHSTAYPTAGYPAHMQQVSKSHPVSAAMQNSFSYYPSPPTMPQGRNMTMPNGNIGVDNGISSHNMMGVQCAPIQNPSANGSAWRYQNPSAPAFPGTGFMEAAFGRGMATSGGGSSSGTNNAQFTPQLYQQSPYYPCLMPMMRPES